MGRLGFLGWSVCLCGCGCRCWRGCGWRSCRCSCWVFWGIWGWRYGIRTLWLENAEGICVFHQKKIVIITYILSVFILIHIGTTFDEKCNLQIKSWSESSDFISFGGSNIIRAYTKLSDQESNNDHWYKIYINFFNDCKSSEFKSILNIS